jgi:hypothetical protein
MPLSEDDQGRLDEIERALRADDPKFAAGHSIERVSRRRAVTAGAMALIGAVQIVVGLVSTQAALVVGVIVSLSGSSPWFGGTAFFIHRPRGCTQTHQRCIPAG